MRGRDYAFPGDGTLPLIPVQFDMRRFTAIPILLILLFSWGAPLLAAWNMGSLNNLPACCRRNGKHHCMMQMMQPVSGEAISGPVEKCPFFPKGVPPLTTRAHLFISTPGSLFYAAVQSHSAIAAQTEARYRVSWDRSRLKRGPPARA